MCNIKDNKDSYKNLLKENLINSLGIVGSQSTYSFGQIEDSTIASKTPYKKEVLFPDFGKVQKCEFDCE